MNKIKIDVCEKFGLSDLNDIYNMEPTDAALLIYEIIKYIRNKYNIEVSLHDLYNCMADINLLLNKI